MTNIPDTRSLVTLRTVVDSGSFSAAAHVLRVTPAAVSKLIARLELELGIRIFNRSTRQISLTPEGDAFYRAVVAHLGGLQDAIDNAREQLRAPAGVVRASIANSFGKMFLIPKLGKFLEAYPGISLDLCFDDVPRDLISRGYDVEIRYGAPSDSRYICRRLCGLPLALVASPAYLARRGTPRTPHDLAAHDCITTSIGTRRAAWRFTPGSGGKSVIIHPTGHFNVADQLDGVIDGALAGLGITLAHRGAVRHFVERGDLATVLDDHVITSSARGGSAVYLLYPHREFLSNRVRLFIDFLSDCFSDSEYQEVAPDELEDGEVDLDALT